MPEELWREAAVLAGSDGVYRISQALGVSYETLRSWTAKSGVAKAQKRGDGAGFVAVELPSKAAAGPVIELAEGDGAKLTIRLPAHSAVDVAALASSWRSRRR